MQQEQVQKLLQAHALLSCELEHGEFESAAEVTLAIAGVSQQLGYYIRALNYLINAERYSDARNLLNQLSATEARYYGPVLLAGMRLELETGNERAAAEILKLLKVYSPNDSWAAAVLDCKDSVVDGLTQIDSLYCTVRRTATNSKGELVELQCKGCNHYSRQLIADTQAELTLLACPACSRPHLARLGDDIGQINSAVSES